MGRPSENSGQSHQKTERARIFLQGELGIMSETWAKSFYDRHGVAEQSRKCASGHCEEKLRGYDSFDLPLAPI
jgi:hypothetical protein